MSDVKDELRRFICSELLGRPEYPLRDDERLVTGGLIDSFSLAHVAVFIEQRFGVFIPDVELTAKHLDTLTQIAARVAAG